MSNLKEILNALSNEINQFGYPANLINIEKIENIQVPNLIKDEIPTLNQFGFMKIELDKFAEAFINFAKDNEGMYLDLGTAFGFVTNSLLKTGRKIIANDISYEHLSVLLKTASKESIENLYLYPGRFPNEITLPNRSIKAVYTARMLHFLDEIEMDIGFKKIYECLADGGKFYFVSVTPYHANIKEGFQQIYEERLKSGEKWPGKIRSQWEINPRQKNYVPEFLHVFEPRVLEKLLPEYGFKIDEISMFDYPNDTDSDGKGHVGLIATKI